MEPTHNPNDPLQRPAEPNPYPPPPPIYNDAPSSNQGDHLHGTTPPPGPPPVSPAGSYTHDPRASATGLTKDERNWAMFAHLSALVLSLVASMVGLTFLGFLGPLVIYLMKKDESPFIADQAKEALNFNISIGIIMFILFVLSFTLILMVIAIPAMIILGLAALVFTVIAAIKASDGTWYRYPFTIRLIK